MPDSGAFSSFVSDVLHLLRAPDAQPAIEALAQVAWAASFMRKEARIAAIERYLSAHGTELQLTGLRSYDILELVICLAHFRRAKFPSAEQ